MWLPEGLEEGGKGSCFMGLEFQICKIKKFLRPVTQPCGYA